MVYLAANIPKLGESHLGQCMAFAASMGVEISPVFDVKDGVATFVGSEDVLFNDFPADTKGKLRAVLKPQSVMTLTTPLTAAAHETIPGWYLVCTQDNNFVASFQEYLASVPGAMMEVRRTN
ncbi:hypothetical protein MMC15_007641 [Xylographa vitiligo]|nr:hypothetical protein [Xylographa vitiligo]